MIFSDDARDLAGPTFLIRFSKMQVEALRDALDFVICDIEYHGGSGDRMDVALRDSLTEALSTLQEQPNEVAPSG